MTRTPAITSIPRSRLDRWELLRDFLSAWYRPLTESDGVPEAGINASEQALRHRIPSALREWYMLAGHCEDLWSHNDLLLQPSEIRMNGDVLVFMVENQGVVEWGIESSSMEDDPPVVVSSLEDQDSWLRVTDSVSQFALQAAVYCLKGSKHCKWWGNACVPSEIVYEIQSKYERLLFTELHWPCPIQYFGGQDLFVVIEPQPGNDEHDWITVFTRTLDAANNFDSEFGCRITEWNVRSDEWPSGWVSS